MYQKQTGMSVAMCEHAVGGHLRALVPGQRAHQVGGQHLDGRCQGVADVLGAAAVGRVQEDDVAGGPFDHDADGGDTILANDQVAFPVAGHGSGFHLGGPFADPHHGSGEPRLAPLGLRASARDWAAGDR